MEIKKKVDDLYPEVIKSGSLNNALDEAFRRVGSALRTIEITDKLPFSYARVEYQNKDSQLYIAAEEKLYLPDYWKDGVCFAHGAFDDLDTIAKSIDMWLMNDISIFDLAKSFLFVDVNEEAKIFEEGKEIEYKWNEYLNDKNFENLHPFIDLAMKDEIVGKLFPYTSLMRLRFSKYTGYPYSFDLPFVYSLDGITFEVVSSKEKDLGKGNAEQALKIVKDNLPPNIGSAVKGTANDYENG